jgi:hypothetical protein
MSDLIYINEYKRFINLDQVITAEFEPEHDIYADEDISEGEEPRVVGHKDDRLIITTTELEMEQDEGYDGKFLGVTATSKRYVFCGPTAKSMFGLLRYRSEGNEIPL